MKKFRDGEIFYNVIRAYPKVKFFANNGRVRYDRQNYPSAASNVPVESVGLFDLINREYAGPIGNADTGPVIDNALLTEGGDFLITEAGDNIIIEG